LDKQDRDKTMNNPNELIDAITITEEFTNTTLTKEAKATIVKELQRYPHNQAMDALRRCYRELTGRLTIAAIIQRIDDGRPGPDEAWAMLPRSEQDSVVWTREMVVAWGIARKAADPIAERMAFRQAYERELREARDEGRIAVWTPSLGRDPGKREAAITQAVEKGRITQDQAIELLPGLAEGEEVFMIEGPEDEGSSPSVMKQELKKIYGLLGNMGKREKHIKVGKIWMKEADYEKGMSPEQAQAIRTERKKARIAAGDLCDQAVDVVDGEYFVGGKGMR
jgi:hypothetical protein